MVLDADLRKFAIAVADDPDWRVRVHARASVSEGSSEWGIASAAWRHGFGQ